MGKSKWTKKIAIKAGKADLIQLRNLAVDILEAKPIVDLEDVTAFFLTDGTLLELYSNFGKYPEYLFKSGSISISFKVPDLIRARDLAVAHGFTAMTDVIEICPTLFSCHLKSADGTVIGFYEDRLDLDF